MKVKVLFFGMVKDIVSASEAALDLPDGAHLGQVFDVYAGRFPALDGFRSSIILAVAPAFLIG